MLRWCSWNAASDAPNTGICAHAFIESFLTFSSGVGFRCKAAKRTRDCLLFCPVFKSSPVSSFLWFLSMKGVFFVSVDVKIYVYVLFFLPLPRQETDSMPADPSLSVHLAPRLPVDVKKNKNKKARPARSLLPLCSLCSFLRHICVRWIWSRGDVLLFWSRLARSNRLNADWDLLIAGLRWDQTLICAARLHTHAHTLTC